MISKASAILGSAQAIDYIMKEEKNSYELCRNDLIGDNGAEILAEMREVQKMNSLCKKNTFSIVLSPSNDTKHSPKMLLEFAEKHLENLGLKDNQYIAYVHQNTKAIHIHIIANRINDNGKALNDSYIGFKAQHSAESIAKEYGLTLAKDVRKERKMEVDFDKSIRKEIKSNIYKAHNKSVLSSRNRGFYEYVQQMHDKGFIVMPTINKGGKLQGFRIKDKQSELNFKASEIHKNCSIKTMAEKGVKFENITFQIPIENNAKLVQKEEERKEQIEAEKVENRSYRGMRR